jgi:hypothetical protein
MAELNVFEIPPFLSDSKLIPLDDNIINEPYTNNDTGFKPEIKIKRPFFCFKISEDGIASACVNNKTIFSAKGRKDNIPKKCYSNISVLNIYDTYGVDMVYSFLFHVCSNKYSNIRPDWLIIYLGGSILMFNPSYIDRFTDIFSSVFNASITTLCTFIITYILELEKVQPILNTPLDKITQILPTEIISKILQSKRISKKISNYIKYNNSDEISEAELRYYSDRPYTILLNNVIYLGYLGKDVNHKYLNESDDEPLYNAWYIKDYISDNPFYLKWKSNHHYNFLYRSNKQKIVAFSIFDYHTIYIKRYGNRGTQYVIEMLKKLCFLEEKQACAWLVQLAYDTEFEVRNLYIRNTEYLYLILSAFVNRAIEKFRSFPYIGQYEIELTSIAEHPCTYSIYQDSIFILTYWDNDIINEWSLQVKDQVFILSKYVGDEVEDDEMDGFIVKYSINDYVTMFSLKEMNGKTLTRGILLELLDTNVHIDNYKDICSWIVQLSYDSNEGRPIKMNGYKELKIEINRLINTMLSKLK